MSILACDLDRTLIYSPRAFWLQSVDAEAPPIVVSELYNGVPISFMTRESERLLLELRSLATFVPVTTRTIAQYARVQLPGPTPQFAITSNGGEILVDGEADSAWRAEVRTRVRQDAAPLAEIEAMLTAPACAAWTLKVNVADGLFVYAIVDREAMPPEWVIELEQSCHALGWSVSVQGRKLYCMPRAVDKSNAVAEVRRRAGGGTVLAAGDSLLDKSMLEQAGVAFRPAHGELHDTVFESPNLTVTASRGILAGEELLRLMTERVLAASRASVESAASAASAHHGVTV